MAARSHTAVDRQGMPACPTEPRNQRTIPGEDLSNGRHDARSRVSAVQDTRGIRVRVLQVTRSRPVEFQAFEKLLVGRVCLIGGLKTVGY